MPSYDVYIEQNVNYIDTLDMFATPKFEDKYPGSLKYFGGDARAGCDECGWLYFHSVGKVARQQAAKHHMKTGHRVRILSVSCAMYTSEVPSND